VKFLIAYVTVTGGPKTAQLAERFVTTFRAFPPGVEDWSLVVIGNGGPVAWEIGALFAGIQTDFYPRQNEGGDIGAFIDVARAQNCDCLVCLGESVYFHRAGWLKRVAGAWYQCGPGMYGFYSSKLVTKHLNTTAFAVAPSLLCAWPEHVRSKEQRYNFEHGPRPFWRHVESVGKPVRLVMWDYLLEPWEWRARQVENEFWRGNQSQCLMWCVHTERYANSTKGVKTRWTANADHGLKT
jgi:hypothetical protein